MTRLLLLVITTPFWNVFPLRRLPERVILICCPVCLFVHPLTHSLSETKKYKSRSFSATSWHKVLKPTHITIARSSNFSQFLNSTGFPHLLTFVVIITYFCRFLPPFSGPFSNLCMCQLGPCVNFLPVSLTVHLSLTMIVSRQCEPCSVTPL